MWLGRIIIRAYNYGGQFQSYSGVELELNNYICLITSLIIVATIVCSQMIPGLAHLIDNTITGPKSEKTGISGKNLNYNIC